MFPRWEGTRKGTHLFDVRFTYTHRDLDYRINKKGYIWEVDTRLRMVQGPQKWKEEERRPRSLLSGDDDWSPTSGDLDLE